MKVKFKVISILYIYLNVFIDTLSSVSIFWADDISEILHDIMNFYSGEEALLKELKNWNIKKITYDADKMLQDEAEALGYRMSHYLKFYISILI